MKNKSTVFVVTGVHNHIEDTKKLLRCIKDSDYPEISAVIVDGGSTDGTCDYIRKKFPKVSLIKVGDDIWWTGSVRRGIGYILTKAKSSDYILTINDDCIFGKHYISDLVRKAKKNPNTIIGSLVLDTKTGKVLDAGVKINWKKAVFNPILKQDNKAQNKLVDVDVLSTKGAIFPMSVFKKVGNFDDRNFPHYLSDYEFTYRARGNGYRLFVDYSSVVFNNSRRTGLEVETKGRLSIKEVFNYLFSRKSKINLLDQFKFFIFHCPRRFRLQCGLSMLKKAVYLLSFVGPFYLLRKIFIEDGKTEY